MGVIPFGRQSAFPLPVASVLIILRNYLVAPMKLISILGIRHLKRIFP